MVAHVRLGSSSEEAPVAVALHGITSNSRAWLAVARALGDRAALVALDLRGRGDSRGLPGPYGLDAHVNDTLELLDALELERAVLVGHSLGGYIVARLGAQHSERVRALVLVDGGLPIPGAEDVDLDAFLGPALARLKLRFDSREQYRAWWRQHPAFKGGDFTDHDLDAYADHDLIDGRSSVVEQAVREDAAALVKSAEAAHELGVPAQLLCAERGLVDDPNPMQPLELAQAWAGAEPQRRSAQFVPDSNHYTLLFGARGAAAVADAIADMVVRWTSP